MIEKILTLIIIPSLIGIAIELFAYWLNKRNDN